MVWALIISFLSLTIDQLTKFFIYGKNLSIIGDFLVIESVMNTGAAFSAFSGASWFFIIMTIPFIITIPYLICTNKISSHIFYKLSLGFILGGMLGNFLDRCIFSAVRDFIYFKTINFAIFNFADMFLCIGTIMLIIYIIFMHDKWKKKGLPTSTVTIGEIKHDK